MDTGSRDRRSCFLGGAASQPDEQLAYPAPTATKPPTSAAIRAQGYRIHISGTAGSGKRPPGNAVDALTERPDPGRGHARPGSPGLQRNVLLLQGLETHVSYRKAFAAWTVAPSSDVTRDPLCERDAGVFFSCTTDGLPDSGRAGPGVVRGPDDGAGQERCDGRGAGSISAGTSPFCAPSAHISSPLCDELGKGFLTQHYLTMRKMKEKHNVCIAMIMVSDD
ncbi:hypothetical protein CCM_05629 [Cordyceps militaris CM01]|uniref:Uncharacterized protein n=1 Tax=Cordyceps militaris (strain CM01) TaxID=983644 RepID=G3JKN2_CORMM|nr:uncharacterized protein CCM_05629 [Cordyceps militaris CM01]EGX91471.1 hypothetical protein CCM_05629 [Cordyceps militaris CM01]